MKLYKAQIGKLVEVRANGTTYTGVLKTMTETDIILQGLQRKWTLPLSQVVQIRVSTPSKKNTPESH